MNKDEISHILEDIAVLLELKGENPFKIRAYSNAARAVESLEEGIGDAIADGSLLEKKGIGKALYEKITELYKTGHLTYYEELKHEVPSGLQEIIKIQGVGPKKAKVLYDALGISTVGELEYACNENRLMDLHGFGKATQDKILKGIEYYKKGAGHFRINTALTEAETLLERIKGNQYVIRSSIAGSIRRRKEIIKDIDIVVSVQPGHEVSVMDFFADLPAVSSIIAKGDTKTSVVLKSGINADLRLISDKEFPYALHYFTGSKDHNVSLRGRAKKMGIKMNEYGLFREEESIQCRDETEIYRTLGLSYIPPELREDICEIEAAENGEIPILIDQSDIKGLLHVHTTYSDSSMTIREAVNIAREMGYQYIGITDHSKSAHYAGGLTEERLIAQHKEIDAINEEIKDFYIFKGIESDILPDGSLDYEEGILAYFDFVIASIHSRFNMDEADMTKRIITALSNPYTTMLGHPTGRLLLSREGYRVDMMKVIDHAAEMGKIIELNSHPFRLDLDWRYCRYAKDRGVKISINPDAHHTGDLANIVYGVGIARKGWLTRGDVINAKPLEEMKAFLKGLVL